jgi:uncharacterized membrane protein
MANLVVVGFDEPHKAEGVCLKLQKLQSEGLLDLADVVVVVKDEMGKAKACWQRERSSQVSLGRWPT